MRRLNLPIWAMMVVVALVAVGFGGLRYPNALTAGCVLSLTVGLLLFALLGAVARQGNGRLPYLGFTAFSTGYLVLAYLTGALTIYPRPTLPTVGVLEVASGAFPVGNTPSIPNPAFVSMGSIQMGRVYVTEDRFWFDQTGHYLLALLIGLIGSVLARYFATKQVGGG